jgi:hypothetical protein
MARWRLDSCRNAVFESMVAVAFQSVFHAEMHQNKVFFIF